jgi:hypothetical protein
MTMDLLVHSHVEDLAGTLRVHDVQGHVLDFVEDSSKVQNTFWTLARVILTLERVLDSPGLEKVLTSKASLKPVLLDFLPNQSVPSRSSNIRKVQLRFFPARTFFSSPRMSKTLQNSSEKT